MSKDVLTLATKIPRGLTEAYETIKFGDVDVSNMSWPDLYRLAASLLASNADIGGTP